MRIALFLSGISDKPGRAERFFGDIYDYYAANDKAEVYLRCDTDARRSPEAVGRLKSDKRLLTFSLSHNRFKDTLEFWRTWRLLRKHRIDLLHVSTYGTHHLPPSIRIANEVHTVKNFTDELFAFWQLI